MEQTEITFRKPNEFQVSPYSAAWISWFHFKKYIILARLNSDTSKWSNCSAYFHSFCQNRFLINGTSCQNIKTRKHTGILACKLHKLSKFHVFILRKKCIFIAFFSSISYNCFLWYLEFYWPGHNFETNSNLAMKFSPKIDTYKSLSGVKFQNHWCPVSQNLFWSVN